MSNEQVNNFKPMEFLTGKLQKSTKQNVDTSKDAVSSVFSEMSKIMDKEGNYGVIANDEVMDILAKKYDITDEDTLEEAVNFLASMDGQGKNVSLGDFGIYQFSSDILSAAGNDLSEDNIKNLADIIYDAIDEQNLTADTLLSSIKNEITVKDDSKILDIINNVLEQDTSASKAALSMKDLEKYANAASGNYSDTSNEETNTENSTKTDETQAEKSTQNNEEAANSTLKNIQSTFKGPAASKIQTDEQTGEYFITSESWDSTKSDNLDCVSRIIYNLYGVSYNSQEGKKIHQALIEKNPEFFKDGAEMVYAGQKLVLVGMDGSDIKINQEEQETEQKEEDENQTQALKDFKNALESDLTAAEAYDKYIDSNTSLDDKQKAKLMTQDKVKNSFKKMDDSDFEELYNSKANSKYKNSTSSKHTSATTFVTILNQASHKDSKEVIDSLMNEFGKDGLLELLNGSCSEYRATVIALMSGYDSESLFE